MKTRKWIIFAGLIVAVAALLVMVPAVLAQGPRGGYGYDGSSNWGNCCGPFADNAAGPAYGRGSSYGFGPMSRMGSRFGGPNNSLVSTVADLLGLTRVELVTELQAGKTFAGVAEEKDVALDTIVEAVLAPRTAWLAERVADELLTPEQADAMLANMEVNVTTQLTEAWSPRGYGPGNGFIDEDGGGLCDYAGTGQMMRGGGRWSQ